ncbi:MAG: pitrilysin family protein [Polyangiales bacterium]
MSTNTTGSRRAGAGRLLSQLAASALGAQLLSHTPAEANEGSRPDGAQGPHAAHAGGSVASGSVAGTGVAASSPARPIKIDAGGGATAFLVENHELPLVDVSISFRSGSTADSPQKLGLTRAMARMLRRGAVGWPSDKIEESIDRFGGEVSTDVGPSSINVHVQVIRRNLAPFMKLVTELLVPPTFPEDELGRLRRETVAEIIENRDQDSSLARRFFRRAVFGSHPYGRSTSGTTKTVPAITRDDVMASHALHIRRSNVVLGVSGDVSQDDVRALILPLVNALPGGAAPVAIANDPTMPKGRRLLFVDKPERTQTQILIGSLGTQGNDEDHVALHVANTIFGGTFTARLMKEVRSKRGWSYGAYSRLPIDRLREAFSMWTFPAATDAAACIELELALLQTFVADGISDQELTFAKSYLSESYAFDIDTPFKRVRQAVDEELLGLPLDYHTGYVRHVLGITRAQANAAVKRRLSADDLAIVVVGTASQLKEAVVKVIPNLASVEVVPFDSE